MGVGAALVILLAPMLGAWYLVWVLPLAWALPRVARRTLVILCIAFTVTELVTENDRLPELIRNVHLPFGHPVAILVCLWIGADLVRRFTRHVQLDAETPERRFGDSFEAGPRQPPSSSPRRSRRPHRPPPPPRTNEPAYDPRVRRPQPDRPRLTRGHNYQRLRAFPRGSCTPILGKQRTGPPADHRSFFLKKKKKKTTDGGRGSVKVAHVTTTPGSKIPVEMTETVLRSNAGHEVGIGDASPFVIIGERINPTGRKKLAEELKQGITRRSRRRARAGGGGREVLDLNAGIPGFDEVAMLSEMVRS